MIAKYIGETYGNYLPNRKYVSWNTGKGYEIRIDSNTVYDTESGLSKTYGSPDLIRLEWELDE